MTAPRRLLPDLPDAPLIDAPPARRPRITPTSAYGFARTMVRVLQVCGWVLAALGFVLSLLDINHPLGGGWAAIFRSCLCLFAGGIMYAFLDALRAVFDIADQTRPPR